MGAAGPPAIRGDQVIMRIQLSDHFTMRRLLRFVVPSVIMMIFTSIYSVVDGIFVSNYAGKTQLAAINLIMPVLMMLAAIGFMVGTGGSALVAKTLGEGKKDLANRYFSMLLHRKRRRNGSWNRSENWHVAMWHGGILPFFSVPTI